MGRTYCMRAKDSVTESIFLWRLKTLDFSGSGYTGPNTATQILCSGYYDDGESDKLGAALFGSGSDGDLIASSGTTTLTRPTYYRTVRLTGSAQIDTNGFPLYIQQLDATGTPPARAISRRGEDGTVGTNQGIGTASKVGSNLGGSSSGGSGGGSGGANVNGIAGGAGGACSVGIGGIGGAGGVGGNGSAGKTGGAGGVGGAMTFRAPQQAVQPVPRLCDNTGGNSDLNILGGTGGGGGGSGGGASGTDGGSGRGGGAGGPVLEVWIGELITDGTTPAALIDCYGGSGADTAAGTPVNGGGAGGSGGGGGGAARVFIGKRTGASVANLVCATGGAGSPGGSANGGTAGVGGQAGGGGTVLAAVLATGACLYKDFEAGGGPVGVGTVGGIPSVWGLTL